MRFARLLAILIGLPVLALAQNKSPTSGILESITTNIDIQGLETNYDPETGIATAKGEAYVKYGDSEVEAGRVDYNSNTGDIIAKEHVTIVKMGVIYKGENIIYNVNTGELHGDAIRSGLKHDTGNVFYTADKVQTKSKYVDEVQGENALITTHDLADPNYHLKAKSITIYPNDRLIMRNVTVYVGDTPIFWLPYVTQPLDDQNGYLFSPGYSSTWGAYLLNQYSMIYGDHTLARYHLDLRSTRGIAAGADMISLKQKDNRNWGHLKIYYANDSSPFTNKANEDRETIGVPTDRYRISFQHRIYVTDQGERTWYLDFDINKLSDEFFLEDFFATEFLAEREPDNQVSLVRSDPRYTATLMAKFQLNDFYETDTRLPEIAFDFTRQPIFNTGFFYQGSTTFGLYHDKLGTDQKNLAATQSQAGVDFLTNGGSFADGGNGFGIRQSVYRQFLGLPAATAGTPDLTNDQVLLGMAQLRSVLDENSFNRLYSYHEVLYPKTVFGWLNVVPRFGVGLVNYSDVKGTVPNIKSGASSLSDFDLLPVPSSGTRTMVHAGLDASVKLSKTWDDVHNDTFGLDGLKHVVQPYINYSYLTINSIDNLPQIDRTVATTRPLPIDVPFYTGIDSLRPWNVARVGVRNTLQTKRDYSSFTRHDDDTDNNDEYNSTGGSNTQAYSWAGLNTYLDVYGEDPEGLNRNISNLYNEIFWRPTPWLTFYADTQIPIGGDLAYTEANYGVSFMPNKDLSIALGHQYIQDHPFFTNSSLIYSRIYARLNDNWGFSMNHVYEAATSTLEYQSYSIHRDLNSWVASLGFLQRDNAGTKDLGLIFSLTLKDFPQVTVPLDTDPNPTGRAIQ